MLYPTFRIKKQFVIFAVFDKEDLLVQHSYGIPLQSETMRGISFFKTSFFTFCLRNNRRYNIIKIGNSCRGIINYSIFIDLRLGIIMEAKTLTYSQCKEYIKKIIDLEINYY